MTAQRCSFVVRRSFVPLFVVRRSFVPLFVVRRSFVPSFLRFLCSFLRSFVSYVPLFVPSFFPSFVRSFLCSFLRSFVPSFLRSLLRSFAPSFLRSFVPSFLRSSVRPFVPPSFPAFLPQFVGIPWGLRSIRHASIHPPTSQSVRSVGALDHFSLHRRCLVVMSMRAVIVLLCGVSAGVLSLRASPTHPLIHSTAEPHNNTLRFSTFELSKAPSRCLELVCLVCAFHSSSRRRLQHFRGDSRC